MNYTIKPWNNKHFTVSAKTIENKIAGTADFFKNKEADPWKARIDVKEKFRKQGVGTGLLKAGDNYPHQHFPGENREFEDINNFNYRQYTDSITDGQIISYEGNKLRFRP